MFAHRNGFYAAVKTDECIQAVYIDEPMFRAAQAQAEEKKRAARIRARRRKEAAVSNRKKRGTIRTVKQVAGSAAAAALIVWWSAAGLIDPVLGVPLVLGLHSLACFRAGRWAGRRENKTK